jgi:hypothetical protein
VTEPVADLQRQLLAAALAGTPLPGCDAPVALPDRAFLGEPPFPLLADDIADPDALEGLGVRMVSWGDLTDEARGGAPLAYLRFRPVERRGSRVRLTLQLGLASPDPEARVLGLGGVQAEFAEMEGEWRAAGPPVYFAA